MNKEQFIEKIKEIKIKTPDELFFLEYNKVVCDILEENQELEKQFEAVKEVAAMHLKNEIQFKAQQKEFIKYLTSTIEELECDDFDDERMKELLLQNIITYKEILSKYKEIIGDKDERLKNIY